MTWSQVLKKRQKILGNLSAHIPHALSVQYWKKEKELQTTVTQEDDRNYSNTENKFINLKLLVESEINGNNSLLWEEKCGKMKGILARISMDDIHEIESVTEKQSESKLWHKARFARVIASTCHDVMTSDEVIGQGLNKDK